MASLGHFAVGMAVGRICSGERRVRTLAAWGLLALAPDLDVLAFHWHIPYGATWGHRGAAHSLLIALLGGLLCAALAPRSAGPKPRLAVATVLTLASHGVLDAMTTGGLGVALAWPWSAHRYFLPWRPIPVAPIGIGMLSARGLHVLAVEALLFLPFFAIALWPPRRPVSPASASAGAP